MKYSVHIFDPFYFLKDPSLNSHLLQKQKGKEKLSISTSTLDAMQMGWMQHSISSSFICLNPKKIVKRKLLRDREKLYIWTSHLMSARATTAACNKESCLWSSERAKPI